MKRCAILVGVSAILFAAVANAQTPPEQNKLLAKRAAEADAYRKLAECVYGLQINSETYVKDFVTESDMIRTSVDQFIKGVRLGKPNWYEDMSCEVEAEVTVAKVVEVLKEAHNRFYKGSSIKTEDFVMMEKRIEKKIIKAIGMGAPRPDLPPDLPQGVEALIEPAPPNTSPAPIPDIWKKVGPQARLMAIQAARRDAQRQLAERIKGLRITSNTTVRDFVTESDTITTSMEAFLRGATDKQVYLHSDELIAEVTVVVPVEQVITQIKEIHSRHYKGDAVSGLDIEKVSETLVKKDFEATGMGVPRQDFIVRYNATAEVKIPDWVQTPVQAEGNGTDPAFETAQGRLKAARAAELDAKRKLAEQIAGLQINSTTLVRDFVTQHDEISTAMDAIMVESSVKSTRFADGVAYVTVEVPAAKVWAVVNDYNRPNRR